jgi:CHAT domain-containing protein/Tfp pilus assembly protein PilF
MNLPDDAKCRGCWLEHQRESHAGIGEEMLCRNPEILVPGSLVWLVLLIAPANAQTSPGRHQNEAFPPSGGVVVEQLVKAGAAQRAGMQLGDILLSWNSGGHKGQIESPFDLRFVGFEYASRGALRIEGRRGSAKKVWILHSLPWGLDTRPNLSNSLLRVYEQAEHSVRVAKIQDAIDAWRAAASAAEEAGPAWLPAWFLSHGGESLYRLKQMEHSDDLYREALQHAEEFSGEVRGEILRQWASELEAREDLSNAEKYYHQELIEWRQLGAQVLASQTLNQIGALLLNKGDLNGAESCFTAAVAISEKYAPGDWQHAAGYANLAVLYQQEGNLGKAEKYYRLALAIERKHFQSSAALAETLTDLGVLALWRGNLNAAEDYHRGALMIAKKLNQAAIMADILDNISDCRLADGDLAGAEDYQERSLALREQMEASLPVASSLASLGKIFRLRKDYDLAEQYFHRALNIADKLEFPPPDRASFLAGLGDIARDRGDFNRAEEEYRKALGLMDQLAPRSLDHTETLTSLGAVLYRQGRLDEAAGSYNQGLRDLEYEAADFGSLNETQARFRAKHVRYYREYIEVLLEKGQSELAFEALESSRARALFEMLSQSQINIYQGIDPALQTREKDLHRLLTAKTQQRVRLLSGQHTEVQLNRLDREMADLRESYEEASNEIRAQNPSYASLVAPQALSLKSIQGLLDRDTVLLEYSLGEERSYLFAVTDNSLKVYVLPKRAFLERDARRLYLALTARTHVLSSDSKNQAATLSKVDALSQRLAAELSRTILTPAADLIKGRQRLLIVAEGALQYIPFAILASPEKSAVPLMVDYEIVSLPSASVLAELRERQSGRAPHLKAVAVLADPVFDAGDERLFGVRKRHQGPPPQRPSRLEEHLIRSASDVGLIQNGKVHFSRLLYTRQEAEAIAGIFGPNRIRKSLDFQASRSAAMQPDLSQYRIVHFATHGLVDTQHPELSGLVLSLVDQQGMPQEGFLGLEDIYNLKLPVDLVVLSACQTGLGEEISGEGLIGLTRGFMYAGANRVVASLWSVDDRATSEFMTRFYRNMERKMTPAAALRKAQLEMWMQNGWRQPYYWAAFQIQGDWK